MSAGRAVDEEWRHTSTSTAEDNGIGDAGGEMRAVREV
jgi:hypothetical protein